jgi:hypothetical protein
MLSGRDIYEQAIREPHYAQLETFSWEHVHPVLAEQYNAIAEKVSTVYIRPLMKALRALEEQYKERHAATRILLSESYAEIDALLRMSEPSPEEAQVREESLRNLQERIYDFLRSDDEPSPSQQIADLKAMLREYHEFNKYDAPQLRANYRAWDAERNALQTRAQELLREEQ